MDLEMSPDEEIDITDQSPRNQRTQRSLTVLTTKFMKLIQEAKDGELDLKDAVNILASGQKRRIYDITNVLEGVGLIVKVDKRIIKWVGDVSYELSKKVRELMSELENLEQMEFMLDQQKVGMEQSIRKITEDCSTYVNHEDICNCFNGNTLLAIRAPSGTQLDVPIPKAVQDGPAKYQIYLKSSSGPIDVVLLNKGSSSSVPLVLPVPPPEEMLRRARLAMSASNETQSSNTHCQASADTTNSTKSSWTPTELHAQPVIKTEPHRAGASKWPEFSKELKNLLDSPNELMDANLITKLVASQVFSPLHRLPSPPSEHEIICNLDDGESLREHYDDSVLSVRP